ncbi:MAG: tetratricopeptide repeat protein [Anaerolineaceae bacterium]|nr:tetratricopeptide repeat protein [Anaerolineaceae bacterium]
MRKNHYITDQEYQVFHELIEKRIGRSIDSNRRAFLENQLIELRKMIGVHDLQMVYKQLSDSETYGKWWATLVRELTVNETYFFRNPMQMEALKMEILPEIIGRNKNSRKLRIWSAGCATGEEPYSIAMILHDILPDISRWDIFILGTDLNRENLDKAQTGSYREWSFRITQDNLQKRFFKSQGLDYQLNHNIKRMVTFQYHNLMEDTYPSDENNTGNMDLILWRNMAIYFNMEINASIASRFYVCLNEKGYFIVGANETNNRLFSQFQSQVYKGTTFYQKELNKTSIEDLQSSEKKMIFLNTPGLRKKYIKIKKNQPIIQEQKEVKKKVPVLNKNTLENQAELEKTFHAANALKESGNLQDALKGYSEILKHQPDHLEALTKISRILANQGKREEAKKYCEKMIGIDPFFSQAYLTLGVIFQEENNFGEAAKYLKKALYLEPDFIMAHVNLAMVYQELKYLDEIKKHFNLAVRLLASFPEEEIIPGSDDLSARQLLELIHSLT